MSPGAPPEATATVTASTDARRRTKSGIEGAVYQPDIKFDARP
jgi:hypothetical protein